MRMAPMELIYLNAWSPVSGTHWKGYGMSVKGEVSLGIGFEI